VSKSQLARRRVQTLPKRWELSGSRAPALSGSAFLFLAGFWLSRKARKPTTTAGLSAIGGWREQKLTREQTQSARTGDEERRGGTGGYTAYCGNPPCGGNAGCWMDMPPCGFAARARRLASWWWTWRYRAPRCPEVVPPSSIPNLQSSIFNLQFQLLIAYCILHIALHIAYCILHIA
jgi:hypothetical protein